MGTASSVTAFHEADAIIEWNKLSQTKEKPNSSHAALDAAVALRVLAAGQSPENRMLGVRKVMIKKCSIVLAVAFFCSPVLAFAQTAPSSTLKACLDEAQGNVMGIKQCSANEEVRLKKELANVLKTTSSKVSKPRKKALSQAQAAWEKFHAANCDFYVDEDAGQMATMAAYQCSIDMYTDRIAELKSAVAQ